MNSSCRRWSRWLVPVALLAFATACQAPPPSWPSDAIGRISVKGPNAVLNQMPVTSEAWLHEGDTIATGDSTWVRVDLREGGVVEIDQNTDPFFQDLLDDASMGRCLLVKVVFGRVFMSGKGLCEEDNNQSGSLHSNVVLRSTTVSSQLLVLVGSVTLHRPISREVHASEILEIRPDAAPIIRPATRSELGEATTGLRGSVSPGRRPDSSPVLPAPSTSPNTTVSGTNSASGRPVNKVPGSATLRGPSKDPTVWCCRSNSLSEAPASVCHRARGQVYYSREEALKVCRGNPIN